MIPHFVSRLRWGTWQPTSAPSLPRPIVRAAAAADAAFPGRVALGVMTQLVATACLLAAMAR